MRSTGPPRARWHAAVVAAIVVLGSCTIGSDPPQPRPASPATGAASPGDAVDAVDTRFRIGPCGDGSDHRCGSIAAPRRWWRPDGDTIRVRFRVVPRLDPDAADRAPIVAMEGGPGYGSIGSAGSFRRLFGPLLRTRDLILMDQRGTGASEAIDCPGLQRGAGDYADLVAACARRLGDDANTYGSAAAADDMAAILDGLGAERADVYGDSYGTYLAQVFGLRHPDRTRSLVLDGAYDDGFDPFARDAAAAIARSWTTLCERSGACPRILAEIDALARDLAEEPLVGVGVDGSGRRRRVEVGDAELAQMLYDGAYVFTIYRDLPGAIAALRAGDERPFLRLAAEHLGGGGGGDPSYYSEGAYAAVACHDYPTIWDRAGSIDERRAELGAAIAALPEGAFAPLTNGAWLRSSYEVQLVEGCLGWPAPDPQDPPLPTAMAHPDTPVLVLSGEFDITTPAANGRMTADAWPDATYVEVRNEIHVAALYDQERCASAIVRRFIRMLDAGDTSCAERTPEIHVVRSFPAELDDAPQARPLPGDRSTASDRRIAWVVGETVGDALSRWWNVTYGGGAGLRGGRFATRGSYEGRDPLVVTLRGVRFVDDVAVDGRVVWTRPRGRLDGTVAVSSSDGDGRLRLQGTTRGPGAPATITGTIDGRHVDVEVPMPWSP